MKKFEYIKADSYEEASKIIKSTDEKIDPVAAGTDVLGTYKDRLLTEYPKAVVSLKHIKDNDYIKEEDDVIRIGAGATLKRIAESEVIKNNIAALAQSAYSVASPIIRSTATIGGNICQDVRCWYYRYPDEIGGRLNCKRKGGDTCYAIVGENRYHSIFGGMSTKSCSNCQHACPAGTDISAYMAKIREGRFDEAARIFFQYNPMPMMTSRICPHLCTAKCNQNVYGEAVNIPSVERSLGEYILEHKDEFYKKPERLVGKKIAIIGAGPGGLTCAYYLRDAGFDVDVYDTHEKAGGVLRYGIPHYRLPKSIVDEYVSALENMGVNFILNTTVGKDIELDDIKAKHDGVYLGTGAWNQPVLGIDNEKLTTFGLNFLEEVNTYLQKTIGEEVLVCGGGNVAMDVALTASRLGAKKVKLVCLEQRHEMPASADEIEMALEEGVEIINGWGLDKVETDENGKVIGLRSMKCTSVKDEFGRFAPKYDREQTQLFTSDFIILATGQRVDISFIPENLSSQIKTNRGLIDVDSESGKTRQEGYYAGGDMVTGPNLAISAIKAGRVAAMSIIRDFKAYRSEEIITNEVKYFDVEHVEETKQVKLKQRSVSERSLTLEDRLSLSQSEAINEAKRCMNCACYAVNASDITPVLVMLNASIVTTERTLSAKELFTTKLYPQMVLHKGELVKEIIIKKTNGVTSYDKRRVRDAIDFAIVSLASRFVVEDGICKDCDLVFGAVAPVPYPLTATKEFLIGKPLNIETAKMAQEIALKDAKPMGQNEYKVFIAKDIIYNRILEAAGIKPVDIPVL